MHLSFQKDSIVSADGVEVLVKVLADPNTSSKTQTELLTSLSYIASDTHDFKERVASTAGLKALAHVVREAEDAKDATLENVRTVAALLLEISFLPSVLSIWKLLSILFHFKFQSTIRSTS